MAFNLPLAVNIPTGSVNMRGMLMRQASYPLWLEQSLASYLTTVNYYAIDLSFLNGVTEVYSRISDIPSSAGCRNTPASASLVGISGATIPPHVYPILGKQPHCVYTYVPAGAAYGFLFSTTNNLAATFEVAVQYEVWTTTDETRQYSTISASTTNTTGIIVCPLGAGTLVTPQSIYVRPISVTVRRTDTAWTFDNIIVTVVVGSGTPTYATSITSRGIITAGAVASIMLLPVGAPPEIEVSERPYSDTRVTAAAVLMTNVTKVLDKEGTALAGRLEHNSGSYNFSQATLSTLHPAEKAFLPLATGLYTYAPPSTDMSGFYDYTSRLGLIDGAGGITYMNVPSVRLDNQALVNCFVLADPDTTTRSSFALNVDWHVEFRNNSTLFEIGMSSITLEAYHQAILQLVSHGFFFSNDGHQSLIGKIIKLLPLPPGVSQVASIGVDIMDHVLSKRLNTTPSTTTIETTRGPKPEKEKVASKPKPKPTQKPQAKGKQGKKK